MPFNTFECQSFAREYEFEFCSSSPHYHQSDGMAEKGVGITKNILHKSKEAGKEYWLALMEYHNTPVAGLEYAPAQILMSRLVRRRIPVATNNLVSKIVPNLKMELASKQLQCKNVKCGNLQEFLPNIKALHSYVIVDQEGKVLRRNTKYLRPSSHKFPPENNFKVTSYTDYSPENLNSNTEDNSIKKTGGEQEVRSSENGECEPLDFKGFDRSVLFYNVSDIPNEQSVSVSEIEYVTRVGCRIKKPIRFQ
ncbi:hypothetical protein PR048_001778 [Dryococelus australis]|uniref:Uncharacterized protein n=1 Tax=Dryococelus australis TaxID=614101 RepID=A0ABQ9II86_9NEOP|nr:hypothetical protein PR048_001778 [Dryococelus australis]